MSIFYYGSGSAFGYNVEKYGYTISGSASVTYRSIISQEDANNNAMALAQSIANEEAVHNSEVIDQTIQIFLDMGLISESNQTLTLTGSKGDTGPTGSTGPTGDTGPQGSTVDKNRKNHNYNFYKFIYLKFYSLYILMNKMNSYDINQIICDFEKIKILNEKITNENNELKNEISLLKLKLEPHIQFNKKYYEKNKNIINEKAINRLKKLAIDNPEKIKQYRKTAYENRKNKIKLKQIEQIEQNKI
jgi:hypothetical protein